MGEVVPFGKAAKQTGQKSSGQAATSSGASGKTGAAGNTLCRNGHHRWVVWKNLPFDVRQGKLITVYRCERCGKQRSVAR